MTDAARKPTITRRRTGWFCWTCADTIATSWAGMQRHIDTEHGGGRIETGPDRPKEARVVRVITPISYHLPADRALADAIMQRLDLDPNTVFEIHIAETGVEVGVYVRDEAGNFRIDDERRDLVREWITAGGPA